MATFVEGAIDDIDERLRQLRDELARLEAARAALDGSPRRSSRDRRPRASNRTRVVTTRAPRRRGGSTRANQALEVIKDRPGITVTQIAEGLNIQPNYLYRVLPRLEADGQVKRDGKGWHLAS